MAELSRQAREMPNGSRELCEGRATVSIRLMTIIWELPMTAGDKLVALALADNANENGLCWPSIATIARKCGCSERSVQRSIRKLEADSTITRTEVKGKGCQYTFNPRLCVTPDNSSPVTNTTPTPDTVSPKPSRTINLLSEGARAKGWHRLPEDWQPRPLPAATQAKADLWPPGELDDELEALRNWARNAEDKDGRGRKLDWDAAWVNWVNRHDRERRPQRGGRSSPANDMDAAMRDLGFGR